MYVTTDQSVVFQIYIVIYPTASISILTVKFGAKLSIDNICYVDSLTST